MEIEREGNQTANVPQQESKKLQDSEEMIKVHLFSHFNIGLDMRFEVKRVLLVVSTAGACMEKVPGSCWTWIYGVFGIFRSWKLYRNGFRFQPPVSHSRMGRGSHHGFEHATASGSAKVRKLEFLISVLVFVMAACFFGEMSFVKPPAVEVMKGLFIPRLKGPGATGDAIALLGALIMPHNLFLHSALVLSRKTPSSVRGIKVGSILSSPRSTHILLRELLLTALQLANVSYEN
ncbi:hypothetical protein PR202_gb12721 [Eleusine coracana subsp. coracana]|uniref:Uncharacterized protein n=1 Tax=Eleusine coracana subsp. coracana TaxID=191504 RepID=A0AAV5ER59_ELECO|nr:hypothetical protein PR202_gb12721 [Eleusine coracana subsp. coracana]